MARRGRPFVVAWHDEDTEAALRAAYRAERDPALRQRLQALWLLRSGERAVGEVVRVIGVDYRTVQRWVAWYRRAAGYLVPSARWTGQGPVADAGAAGGVGAGRGDGTLSECRGHWGLGEGDVWGELHRGRHVQPAGALTLCSQSATPAAHQRQPRRPGGVEKGGLRDTLHAAGITLEAGVGWADEMRLGLIGTMRRVWGRRGVKVRQRLQIVYEWRYLHLVVEPSSGTLWWFWSHAMRATVARTLIEATQQETDLAVLVWDRAPSHRDATVQAMGLPLIEQPPGTRLRVSPKLNPVERVFEYLRGQIEGVVYPTIGDKVAAVEAILEELDAHPERVQALNGSLLTGVRSG